MNSGSIVIILAGLFTVAGAAFNWDWFMEHRKARSIIKVLGGRDRARIFYGVLGFGLLVLGILGLTGIVNLS